MKTIWQKCSICKGTGELEYATYNGMKTVVPEHPVSVYSSNTIFEKGPCIFCDGTAKVVFGWIEDDEPMLRFDTSRCKKEEAHEK